MITQPLNLAQHFLNGQQDTAENIVTYCVGARGYLYAVRLQSESLPPIVKVGSTYKPKKRKHCLTCYVKKHLEAYRITETILLIPFVLRNDAGFIETVFHNSISDCNRYHFREWYHDTSGIQEAINGLSHAARISDQPIDLDHAELEKYESRDRRRIRDRERRYDVGYKLCDCEL